LQTELLESKRKVVTESEVAILEIRKGVLAVAALTPEQQNTLQKTKEQQPEKFRSDSERKWKFWANGSTIRIRFLDGDSATHEKVGSVPHFT
jgi:stalled ribosome rescue protein Dom34